MENTVLLGHGSGGRLSHDLISSVFRKHFSNSHLDVQSDAAILSVDKNKIAFTTDSYVVSPVFFPGGNIGKLAVCGTVNDLAVSGASPLYISAGFIIEEGFPLEELETIAATMADEARKAGVAIVTGDTKVVSKGQCDRIFINTAGVGVVDEADAHIAAGSTLAPGHKIIVNGTIADHGMAVMAARNFGNFKTDILSDCASLNALIDAAKSTGARISFMRDATRGGIATVLCEMAETHQLGIELSEENVPVNDNTRGMCELLGFDPFYVANEGKVILAVHPDDAEAVLSAFRNNPAGTRAAIIGEVTDKHPGKAILRTGIGGSRIIDMLAGEQLPRIC